VFTYKFLGLNARDAVTPNFYGSLPAPAEQGQVVLFETETRYVVLKIAGEGLVGDAKSNQEALAQSDIGRGEDVPTIWLQEITNKIYVKGSGRAFSSEGLKTPSLQRPRAIDSA
jgi:hypothetical protein